MIKFKIKGNKKFPDLVGLGISNDNVKLLRKEKPIKIKGSDLGIDVDILIFYGKTEKALLKNLFKLGLIDDETRLHYDDTTS